MTDLWVHGLPSPAVESAERLAALAVSNVVLGEAAASDVAAARQAGLRPWVAVAAFPVQPEEEHLLCRTLSGEPVAWFGSGCPSSPVLRQRLLERVRQLAEWDIEGIFLDGIRFASPFEGIETYFTCSCRRCQAAAADLGFSLVAVNASLHRLLPRLRDLSAEEFDHLAGTSTAADGLALAVRFSPVTQWLTWRAAAITSVVAQVRAVLKAHAPEKQLAAYLFPPSLAPLVGQDYRGLARHLDLISPMIYRLGDGPACLPAELNGLASFLPQAGGHVRSALASMLGLDDCAEDHVGLAAVSDQCRAARSQAGAHARLVPILWLQDPLLSASVSAILAGAPEGVSFYAGEAAPWQQLAIASDYLRSCHYEL